MSSGDASKSGAPVGGVAGGLTGGWEALGSAVAGGFDAALAACAPYFAALKLENQTLNETASRQANKLIQSASRNHIVKLEDELVAAQLKVKEQAKRIEELAHHVKIVCLCGSTRFGQAFHDAQLQETLAGKIVLTIGCNMKSDTGVFAGMQEVELNSIKARLDELHKRKIDLADEVFILNVGGYVGSSTQSELEYARVHGKPVRFLEPEALAQSSKERQDGKQKAFNRLGHE